MTRPTQSRYSKPLVPRTDKYAKAKTSSSAEILGVARVEVPKWRNSNCVICFKPVPQERVDALMTGPHAELTCIRCSTEKPHKGVYMGEHGTSEMKVVDKVYQDSVRDVFRRSAIEVEEEIEVEDNSLEPPDNGSI